MKIERVRFTAFQCDLAQPFGDANFPEGRTRMTALAVRVDTDQGLTGNAVASAEGRFGLRILEPLLVGEDPRGVRRLWQSMVDHVFKSGNAGWVTDAISAVDVALWDLKSKAAGEPLWKTFGAGDRRVSAYASGIDMCLTDDQLHAYYAGMAERGFAAGKLKVGRNQDDDLRRLAIMRDALSAAAARPMLAVDSNEYWSPKQAIRRISAMEKQFDLAWVEEPARRWDVEGLRKVSDGVRAAVATGENLGHVSQFTPLVAGGAVDIVQAGEGTSGLTGAMQVAHLAYAHELPVCVMNAPGHVPAHLAAALPNHAMTEVFGDGGRGCVVSDVVLDDGCIVLGDRPGHGLTFDDQQLTASEVDLDSIPDPSLPGRGEGAAGVR
ncbi:MAG: racemase [Phycisphaeraceae bacterium]|nr:racemase [Phycisphaeraceae bacterium]